MWIICEDGTAMNCDLVCRFAESDGYIVAELSDCVQTVCKSKHYTIFEIIQNIISGTKFMEVQ